MSPLLHTPSSSKNSAENHLDVFDKENIDFVVELV